MKFVSDSSWSHLDKILFSTFDINYQTHSASTEEFPLCATHSSVQSRTLQKKKKKENCISSIPFCGSWAKMSSVVLEIEKSLKLLLVRKVRTALKRGRILLLPPS
jgi:hypothetical protein